MHRLPPLLLLLLLLSGCTYGLIYTHTVEPLDLDAGRTSTATRTAEGDLRQLQFYVSVSWNSNALGDIARAHGMEKLYFADLEVLSVLGVWRRYTVHAYGE